MHSGTEWLRGMRPGAVVVAALVVMCCRPYSTPAAAFSSARVDSLPYDSLHAYAVGLRFDTVVGAADVRRVAFDTGLQMEHVADAGDSARIEPEEGAWALDTSQLAQGRIIARVTTAHFHRPFGFGPRPTYWYVYKKDTSWRSLFLSDSLRRGIPGSLRLTLHPSHRWTMSLSRWAGSPMWSTCSETACCESAGH